MAFTRATFDPQPSTKGIANSAVYETADIIAVVEGAGYFNAIADNLQPNAFIKCVMGDGVKEYFCTTVHSTGVVTIASKSPFA